MTNSSRRLESESVATACFLCSMAREGVAVVANAIKGAIPNIGNFFIVPLGVEVAGVCV